jgi:excisionase family DNA binding protein
MKSGRRKEPWIQNPATHPRRAVCLRVAAHFLDVDERTLRSRLESGALPATRDGKVYRISVDDLVRYHDERENA